MDTAGVISRSGASHSSFGSTARRVHQAARSLPRYHHSTPAGRHVAVDLDPLERFAPTDAGNLCPPGHALQPLTQWRLPAGPEDSRRLAVIAVGELDLVPLGQMLERMLGDAQGGGHLV